MSKLILTIAFGAACGSAFAQAQINFANFVPAVGLNAPITDFCFGGVRLGGSAFAADLYWGPAGTTDSNALTPLRQPANFLSGAGAGYFVGGARTIPGGYGGMTIVVQVRAWGTDLGNSWEQVIQSGSSAMQLGASGLFSVTLKELPWPPVNLIGLTSFAIGNLGCFPPPPPPPPPQPVLVDQVRREGDSLQFHFVTQAGYHYTVEASDSLTSANWLPVGWYYGPTAQAVDLVASCTNGPARFFRVRLSW